ncbi:MAG: hypothetical protein E7Z86_02175 [Methanosphaera stadtmanae]|nr:hypothetical protein [Methanosphaera stadtmanae]
MHIAALSAADANATNNNIQNGTLTLSDLTFKYLKNSQQSKTIKTIPTLVMQNIWMEMQLTQKYLQTTETTMEKNLTSM